MVGGTFHPSARWSGSLLVPQETTLVKKGAQANLLASCLYDNYCCYYYDTERLCKVFCGPRQSLEQDNKFVGVKSFNLQLCQF